MRNKFILGLSMVAFASTVFCFGASSSTASGTTINTWGQATPNKIRTREHFAQDLDKTNVGMEDDEAQARQKKRGGAGVTGSIIGTSQAVAVAVRIESPDPIYVKNIVETNKVYEKIKSGYGGWKNGGGRILYFPWLGGSDIFIVSLDGLGDVAQWREQRRQGCTYCVKVTTNQIWISKDKTKQYRVSPSGCSNCRSGGGIQYRTAI